MDADNKKPEFEDIDRWLDSALRERAVAEPRSGLEERVLARLAAQPKRRTVWWPVVSVAVVVLATAVALVVMYSLRQERIIANGQSASTVPHETILPTNPVTPSKVTKPTQSGVFRRASSKPHVVVPRSGVRLEPEPLPKLPAFPAFRPETLEERLLARLAARRGSFELAKASPDSVPLRDLSLPELKIEPMEGTPPDNAPQE